MRRSLCLLPVAGLLLFSLSNATPVPPLSQPIAAEAAIPADWKTMSPREELLPKFHFDPTGGPKKAGAFVITADEGLRGGRPIPLKENTDKAMALKADAGV